MSDPILPLAVWQEGTLQNDIPANDNALRVEAMSRPCLGVANNAAGGDASGDVWIVGSAATGAFATFSEDDIAIYDGAGWHSWSPVEGLRLVVNGVRMAFLDGAWGEDPSITGGSGVSVVSIITEASPFTAEPGTHDGLARYVRAGGDATFDSAESYVEGMVFNIRATASIELIEGGVTLTPPSGGTLEMTSGMSITIIMTSSTAGDVIGQTVAA